MNILKCELALLISRWGWITRSWYSLGLQFCKPSDVTTKLPKRWIFCPFQYSDVNEWLGKYLALRMCVDQFICCLHTSKDKSTWSGVRAPGGIEPPISWLSWGDPTYPVHWPGIFDQPGKSCWWAEHFLMFRCARVFLSLVDVQLSASAF